MIYFDKDKNAYAFEIENPIAIVDDEVWAEYASTDKWDIVDGVFTDITDTEEYKEKKAQEEHARIQELSMTRGDLFEALILAQGVGKAQLRAMIENFEGLTDIEKLLYLNRFDEALNFHRKHPAVDLIGGMLGITSENMDKFFDTKNYAYLCVETEPKVDTNEIVLPEDTKEPHTLEDESNVDS